VKEQEDEYDPRRKSKNKPQGARRKKSLKEQEEG
jgi:hypothetical protein